MIINRFRTISWMKLRSCAHRSIMLSLRRFTWCLSVNFYVQFTDRHCFTWTLNVILFQHSQVGPFLFCPPDSNLAFFSLPSRFYTGIYLEAPAQSHKQDNAENRCSIQMFFSGDAAYIKWARKRNSFVVQLSLHNG